MPLCTANTETSFFSKSLCLGPKFKTGKKRTESMSLVECVGADSQVSNEMDQKWLP